MSCANQNELLCLPNLHRVYCVDTMALSWRTTGVPTNAMFRTISLSWYTGQQRSLQTLNCTARSLDISEAAFSHTFVMLPSSPRVGFSSLFSHLSTSLRTEHSKASSATHLFARDHVPPQAYPFQLRPFRMERPVQAVPSRGGF